MAMDKHATAAVQVQKEEVSKPDVKDKPESGNVMNSFHMEKKRKSSFIERCLFSLCCCWICDACSLVCTKDKHATAAIQVQKEAGPNTDVKNKPESGSVMKKGKKSSFIVRCLFSLCCCCGICETCVLACTGIPCPIAGD